jgi:alpha-beta hydrolase superfamily lysophospholipase
MVAHVDNTLESHLTMEDGVNLFVRDWPTTVTSKQTHGVILMHGLGEHCGRYLHVARFFLQLGFYVRTYDLRGHGQSDGVRGDVPDTEIMLRDAKRVIDDFGRYLSAPPILCGHSMGGLFSAHFALAKIAPLTGLILSSPALAVRLNFFQRILFKIGSVVMPNFRLTHNRSGQFLSHDSTVIEAYQKDVLVHSKISVRLFKSMLHSIKFVRHHSSQLTIPMLLLVALDDHIIDSTGSKIFSEKLTTFSQSPIHQLDRNNRITTIFYPGFYHEIFNELEAERAFNDIQNWLEKSHFLPN